MLTPPEPQRLSDQVESQIEDLIASSEFPVGSRLPGERTLMTRLSVSRPVIREAINRLESRGLLRVYASRGTYVTGTPEWGVKAQWQSWVSKDQGKVLALLEVRECLEIRAAVLACERGSEAELAELRLSHLSFEQQVARASVADMSHWDKVFHHQLAVCSGNPVLASFIQNANDTLTTQRRSVLALPPVAARSLEEHGIILEAVESRNSIAAMSAVAQHLESTRQAILKTTSDTSVDTTSVTTSSLVS